jgi:crotonobetainyl-CoA:carnitine CoA-transferase CaiB-like acyl-CoA transferase
MTALAGLRVLDLTRYIPGPYCTQLLAALGADVIKIEEPPFGDATRAVPPAPQGESVAHAVLNRGKRSLLVDLRQADGVEIVRRLAARADVLVESFRPGVLERRGLGAGVLRDLNPRLVYCSLSGFGAAGALAARAGHDVTYAARAGLIDLNRDAAGEPHVLGFQAADMTGALNATVAILAALLARAGSGVGQQVEVSLLGAALTQATLSAARAAAGGPRPDELTGSHACYQVYRCGDGRHLAVGALEPKFWERLCRALELPELIGRQWEEAPAREHTRARLAARFAERERDEWLRRLAPFDACVEPVLTPEEALADAQARPYASEVDVGGLRLRALGVPFQLHGTPAALAREAPEAGAHGVQVLTELGYSGAQIDALRRAGACA